jgi:endoglucanase
MQARGPSGYEGEVRRIVREIAKDFADEITVDALGNVLATRKGTDPSLPTVMLCAHMDEVGLQITGANEDGLLTYATLGDISPAVMASKRVLIGKAALPGVIGSKAVHLQERGESSKAYTHKDLTIDIGAKDKNDALAHAPIGEWVTFDSETVEFGEGLIKGRSQDDRCGCYALLRLMEKQYPCTVVYAFTVQEEVGTRGAKVAAHRVQPDVAIILETTTAGDVGEAQEHEEVCNVGKGPAISFMDLASVAHQPLMRALRGTAERNGIPWQVKRYVSGGNDSGSVQRAGAGVKTCVVSVPCRYIHSPSSVCSLDDVDNMIRLLAAFLADEAALKEV